VATACWICWGVAPCSSIRNASMESADWSWGETRLGGVDAGDCVPAPAGVVLADVVVTGDAGSRAASSGE
jgi:hypothetical protein